MSRNLLIVLLVLLPAVASQVTAQESSGCLSCHPVQVTGLHASLSCDQCHAASQAAAHQLGSAGARAGCGQCHPAEEPILRQQMAHRQAEKDYVAQRFADHDPRFFQANCNSCHLASCGDCHGSGHQLQRPSTETCLTCHKGSYVGWDYLGRAPREDSLRYQRGPVAQGEHYLLMRPDVHAERGMSCGDCHGMASLAAGESSAKTCLDCHSPDPQVIEHAIPAHLERLECSACHSAWSPQEYGTFYLRMIDSPARDYFRVRQQTDSEYLKSAYLKLQEAPPLGLNEREKISPLRPLISYYSEIVEGDPVGAENRLVAADWQAFFPHTVRRGTALCDQCHDNPRRFLLEAEASRIYQPDLDGLGLVSFWNRQGQQVLNGSFLPAERVAQLSRKSPEYTRAYVKKWQQLIQRVDASSASASQ